MVRERHVKSSRNGNKLRGGGERRVGETARPTSLLAVLATLAPLDEDFPPAVDPAPDPVKFDPPSAPGR